jgi:hypothetical protein
MMFQKNSSRWKVAVIICLLVTVALSFVPYGRYVLYPFNLLTTFIHESFHVLAGLVTGAQDISMKISLDTSGLTTSRGGWRILIIPAGYIGTTFFGSLFLLINSRRGTEKFLFIILGLFVLLITLIFSFRSPLTLIFGIIIGTLSVVTGIFFKGNIPTFLMSFISIQLALNSLWDIRDLIYISLDQSTPTDAQSMSREILPLPPIVWAVLFGLVSTAILFVVLRIAFSTDDLQTGNSPTEDDIKTEVL